MTPTTRAVLCGVAIVVIALAAPTALVLVLALALLLATAVDATFARRAIRLRRRAPSVAIIAQPAPFAVEVHDATAAAHVRVRQPRTPDLRIDPAEADGTLDGTITPLRRGQHVLPAVAARQRGPFGLAAWDFRGDGNATLTVHPDVPAARRLAHLVRTGRFRDADTVARGPLGLGTEFESIRDYQPDDDVRQINWAATRRVGRPMSNQYRVEAERNVICLLDCGRLMQAPIGERTRLDLAIDAVAALAYVSEVVGDRCGVIAFDRAIRRRVGARRRAADAVVHAIHDLEPSTLDTDYQLAVLSVRNAKRALVVLFSDLLDDAAARNLLEAVPLLARRHAVVVASVVDPAVERALTVPPRNAGDVYRATSALDIVDARTRVVTALGAAGGRVVEATPDQLATACVAAYLRLKDSASL